MATDKNIFAAIALALHEFKGTMCMTKSLA